MPIIYGIMPLKSVKQARYMNENVPGVQVPEEMIAILEKDGAEGGMRYIQELVQQLKPVTAGIHIFPMRQYHLAERIIEVL